MKPTALCIAAALFAIPAHATTTWIGGGTQSLFDSANYDGTGPVESTGAAQAPFNDNLAIASANIGGGAGYTVGFGRLQIGQGFNVTFDGTTVDATGNTGGFSGTGNDLSSSFDLLNNTSVNIQFVLNAVYSIDGTSGAKR